jgi:hypothetical protein
MMINIPNHEGEECGESYSRMIFLQIMRERSVARAIPHPVPHDLEQYYPGIEYCGIF